MRILHTSDWHLGQHLMSKDRKKEHEKFLDWLIAYLKDNTVDVLIVAGDIFDTGTPPNYALKLYYNFLQKVSETPCRKIIIIGGNHDSVSNLNAPKELLKLFNIHVVGGIDTNGEGATNDDIIVVKNSEKIPIGIVCIVPFLRERDVRKSLPGESYEEKSLALLGGIKHHYHQIKERALAIRNNLPESQKNIPIISTGHLFTAGGKISDGIRDIYVGSLSHFHASFFPSEFRYIALGHLHKPQKVSGLEHIRYSGSPIPLSFSETGTSKEILSITFEENAPEAKPPEIVKIPIPEFQKLMCIKGDLDGISKEMGKLSMNNSRDTIWIEIQHDSDVWEPDIRNKIMGIAEGLPVEILAIKNVKNQTPGTLSQTVKRETLHELSPFEVFQKRLLSESVQIDSEDEAALIQAYNEIMNRINETET